MSKKKGWRYPRGPIRRELAAFLLHVLKLEPLKVDLLLGHFKTALHTIENRKHIAEHYLTGPAQKLELVQLRSLEVTAKKLQTDEDYFKAQVDIYLKKMVEADFHLPPIQRSGE